MPPSTVTRPGNRRQFHFQSHVRVDGYERFQVSNQIGNPQCQLVAQVLVIPSGRFGMTVREDQDVIKLDFRNTVTRPAEYPTYATGFPDVWLSSAAAK